MNFVDWLKEHVFKKKQPLEHLSNNPKGVHNRFINDEDEVRRLALSEYKVWYVGDSNELLNYYTNRDVSENAREPIYTRNKKYYFWGINATETNIKRVHSGLPKTIIDTLSNVIGVPSITIADETANEQLQNILDANTFNVILNQQQRPLTLVEGWGAYKVIFDKNLSDHPIIQYYEAEDVEFITNKGICTGIVYKDYYKLGRTAYTLIEVRSVVEEGTKIEYHLFRTETDRQLSPVPLDTIPELAELPEDGQIIQGYKGLLGVPCRYYFDVNNKNYGRSIFQGKLDLFDDLDQSLSQRSQTCRVSTPIEYFPEDLLERGRNGEVILPSVYNRQFIKKPSIPNGDGETSGDIQVTQPQLNFQPYSDEQNNLLSMACAGILSIPTLGMDISRKDNAEAQREKEKVTIMTRNNVIDMETQIIKKLCNICLSLQEYMDSGVITLKDYDVSVKYNEFANPSFESLSQVLTPMFTQGAISTEMYVEKLYGDSLGDEEKQQEIEWLEQKAQQDNLEMGDFDLNGADEDTIGAITGSQDQAEENIGEFKE